MTKKFDVGVAKMLAVFALGGVACGAWGDGYRNPPPTAEGIGKSGANMVFVDDASAISYNPANLGFQTNISIVLDLTLAQSENTFNNSASGQAVSDDPWVALPNLYVSMPVGDRLVLGLGVTTPLGQGIEFNKDDLVNIPAFLGGLPPAIHEAEIGLVNFNPTIAFRIGDRVSVGVGADIYYSTLEFKQFYPWTAAGLPFDQNAEVDADGYGFGGNAAITWKVTEKQNLALSYRSAVKVDYEGDLKVDLQAVAPPQLVNSSFDMAIKYPTIIGAGYGIALTDTVRMEANLEWLEWSENDTQTANLGVNGTQSAPQDWDNTLTFSLGGDWRFSKGWIVRTGYAFIESPIPDETMAPILPDADRHVLSLGLGYTFKGHSLDLAYAYSIYDDRNVVNNQHPGFNGTYEIDSNLVGLTYSLSF